jgi:hypothetical protein
MTVDRTPLFAIPTKSDLLRYTFPMKIQPTLPAAFLTLASLAIAEQQPTSEQAAFFKTEVKPILEKSCNRCHGGEEKLKGNFRITSREGILKGGDQGTAYDAANPAKSLLLEMLSYKDEDHEMPPKEKLPQEQVDILSKWVTGGLPFPPEDEIQGESAPQGKVITALDRQHWAYQPVKKPVPPVAKDAKWIQNPIDQFVLAKLENAGLRPNPRASKEVLIRRLFYDLLGLPPSPEEVQAFLQDKDPAAFDKMVDDLLARPQYGEKWGRHWLDLVRFAETNGYERDGDKPEAWRYRDYVIRAFNEDKPYDRFIQEQIAGDELPGRNTDAIIATGFHRLGTWDDEPADRDLAKYDYLDDILRTTGESFLGVTIGCARCHDHKIDPLLMKDYYSMLAFFHDITPHGNGNTNLVEIPEPDDEALFQKKKAAKEKAEEEHRIALSEIEKRFRDAMAKQYTDVKIPSSAALDTVKEGKALHILPDARNSSPAWEFTTQKPGDNWFDISFDDSKWQTSLGGFGRKGTPGSVVRTNWHTPDIWLRRDFRLGDIPGNLALHLHHDEDVEIYLNGGLVHTAKGYTTGYIVLDIYQKAELLLQTGKNTIAVHCKQTGGGQYIDVGLSTLRGDEPTFADVFRKYAKSVLPKQDFGNYNRRAKQLAESLATKMENSKTKALAVSERGSASVHILARGNPRLRGDQVTTAFPVVLGGAAAEIPESYPVNNSSGKRRVLAEWIASKDNPLTSRVMANRAWHFHFGRGIVKSTSDFGLAGDKPTHPELLDWLAAEFVENGWSLKKLHKTILSSNTWQMSSAPNDKSYKADPLNDFFWRQDMRRLTAEELRDSILNLTGKLNLRMAGPSITPPMPKEILATASRFGAGWNGLSGPEHDYRRSVYVKVRRSLKMPLLQGHDMADTDAPCAVRFNTTVPTQALTLLNSEMINQAAADLAARLRQTSASPKEQVREAFRVALCREPGEKEIQAGLEMIREIAGIEGVSDGQALERFALLTINLNEFVYLD